MCHIRLVKSGEYCMNWDGIWITWGNNSVVFRSLRNSLVQQPWSLTVCCVYFWVVFAACLSVGLQKYTPVFCVCAQGRLPRSTVDIWASLSYLSVHSSRRYLNRFIQLGLNSINSPKNWTNRTRFSKLCTCFAFTNTDSDDVTWGCSLTVVVSCGLQTFLMWHMSTRDYYI